MTSISNVNNQVSYFSELPQELKSVIYSKLCGFAKNGDKEALKVLIQSAYISKQFFHDPEVKKDRNLCLLDIKMRKECPDDIYKVYLYSIDKLGFLPMIGNASSDIGDLFPNLKEVKFPIAFVEDKESAQKGFLLIVRGKNDATAQVVDGISRKKILVKDISDVIFVFQRYLTPFIQWYIPGKIPCLFYKFCKDCDNSLPFPSCFPDRWMPIILNIIEGKDPYFELDSGK